MTSFILNYKKNLLDEMNSQVLNKYGFITDLKLKTEVHWQSPMHLC